MSDGPAILVTGGAGYIGSHCCRALVAAGYHPVVLRQFFDRPPQLRHRLAGDRRPPGQGGARPAPSRSTTSSRSCTSRRRAWSANPSSIRRNITGTMSSARCRCWMRCARPGCNRLVFSSTGAVYGNADSKALPESYPVRADQSVRRLEMDDRTHPRRLSQRLRVRGVLSALFQRQRRRRLRRHRRAARQRNPSHSPRHDGAAGPCRGFRGVRRRLRHARRHRDPRLHSRHRSGGRPCACAETADAGTFRRRFQSRHRHGLFGARDSRRPSRPRPAARCPMSSSRGDPAIRPIWSPTPPRRARP